MKTQNLRTRSAARTLTSYLKAKGLPAVAPRKKDAAGRWDVSLQVNKGSLGRKAYTVINGKAVSTQVNLK